MKKFLFCITTLLLCASPAFALLSPFYQSVHEIRAILDSQEAIGSLPQAEPIEAIYKVQNGYVAATQSRQVLAEIKYIENSGVGPKKFVVIPHKPTQPSGSAN